MVFKRSKKKWIEKTEKSKEKKEEDLNGDGIEIKLMDVIKTVKDDNLSYTKNRIDDEEMNSRLISRSKDNPMKFPDYAEIKSKINKREKQSSYKQEKINYIDIDCENIMVTVPTNNSQISIISDRLILKDGIINDGITENHDKYKETKLMCSKLKETIHSFKEDLSNMMKFISTESLKITGTMCDTIFKMKCDAADALSDKYRYSEEISKLINESNKLINPESEQILSTKFRMFELIPMLREIKKKIKESGRQTSRNQKTKVHQEKDVEIKRRDFESVVKRVNMEIYQESCNKHRNTYGLDPNKLNQMREAALRDVLSKKIVDDYADSEDDGDMSDSLFDPHENDD